MAVTVEEVNNIGNYANPRKTDYFITLPSGVEAPADERVLVIQLVSATLSGFGVSPVEVMPAGYKRKLAGGHAWPGSLSVSYLENSDLRIYRTFKSWYDIQFNDLTGASANEADYKVESVLKFYDNDNETVTAEARYRGTFVESVADVSLDKSSDERVRVEVTLSYDYMTMSTPGGTTSNTLTN